MYIYSVYYWDDINEKMTNDKGIVSANSFSEAVERLTTHIYDNVSDVSVHELETSESGYLTFEDIQSFFDDMNIDIEEKGT